MDCRLPADIKRIAKQDQKKEKYDAFFDVK